MSPSLQFPKIHSLQLAVHDMKMKAKVVEQGTCWILDSLASLEGASPNEKCAGPALGAALGLGHSNQS